MRRYLKKRRNSFYYAFKGLATLVRTQPNMVLHLIATIAVIVAGFWFSLSSNEWIAVSLAIALVWVTEAVNTAIEFLTDLTSPEFHPLAGKVKDVAAAAVLIAALFAVFIAFIVFLPKL